MTGLKRIFRRRAPGSPRRSAAGFPARLKAGLSRVGPDVLSRLRPGSRSKMPWGKRAARQPALQAGDDTTTAAVSATEVVGVAPDSMSFRDRGMLRRRLRFLRRARELAFRDVGGLIFDMRRFGVDRPDLVEAKLAALTAVDRELRALERVLEDRRPIHELREPGLSSCPRCGALHASEDNFCPRCGLQFGGAQAMGEVGGAIAAPPQPPPAPAPAPVEQHTSPTLVVPGSGLDQAAAHTQPSPARAPEAAPQPARAPEPAPQPAQTPSSVPSDELSATPDHSEQQTEIYRPRDAP